VLERLCPVCDASQERVMHTICKVGDKVQVTGPVGKVTLKILAVSADGGVQIQMVVQEGMSVEIIEQDKGIFFNRLSDYLIN